MHLLFLDIVLNTKKVLVLINGCLQTGLGTVIRLAVGWLPSRKVNEAKLAVSALNDTDPVTMREYIAAKRSSDPMFNAAWKKEVDNARKTTN